MSEAEEQEIKVQEAVIEVLEPPKDPAWKRVAWWVERIVVEGDIAEAAVAAQAPPLLFRALSNIMEASADMLGDLHYKVEEQVMLNARNLLLDLSDKYDKEQQ